VGAGGMFIKQAIYLIIARGGIDFTANQTDPKNLLFCFSIVANEKAIQTK